MAERKIVIGGQCRTLTHIDAKGLAVVAVFRPDKFTTELEKLPAENVATLGPIGLRSG
jgi:hypothetical protein